MELNLKKEKKQERFERALKVNLKKRKNFLEKIKKKTTKDNK